MQEADIEIVFGQRNFQLNAAVAGQGLTLGLGILVEEFIASGQLVRLGPVVSKEDFGYLLRNRHKHNSVVEPVIEWFIDQTKPQP